MKFHHILFVIFLFILSACAADGSPAAGVTPGASNTPQPTRTYTATYAPTGTATQRPTITKFHLHVRPAQHTHAHRAADAYGQHNLYASAVLHNHAQDHPIPGR